MLQRPTTWVYVYARAVVRCVASVAHEGSRAGNSRGLSAYRRYARDDIYRKLCIYVYIYIYAIYVHIYCIDRYRYIDYIYMCKLYIDI